MQGTWYLLCNSSKTSCELIIISKLKCYNKKKISERLFWISTYFKLIFQYSMHTILWRFLFPLVHILCTQNWRRWHFTKGQRTSTYILMKFIRLMIIFHNLLPYVFFQMTNDIYNCKGNEMALSWVIIFFIQRNWQWESNSQSKR